jgi:hypothetical protein
LAGFKSSGKHTNHYTTKATQGWELWKDSLLRRALFAGESELEK